MFFRFFFLFVYFCSLLMCLAVRGCIGRYLPYQTNPRLSTSTLPHKPYSLPSSAQDIWWWCISYYQTQSRIYMEFFKIDFISTLLHKPNTLSHLFLWVFDDDTRNIIKCNRKFKTRIFGIFTVSLSLSSFSSNRIIILTSMMENIELILSGAVGRLSF